jgi:RimJ/RimL family protein N-acetyltransferase
MQSPTLPYSLEPMAEEIARMIMQWRYPEPYQIYSLSANQEVLDELLDQRSPHFAVFDQQHALIGFFAYGTAGRVEENPSEPKLYMGDRTLTVGLALHPDLTGKKLGEEFFKAGLEFARQSFAPESFQLFVLSFNERAIKLYKRVGFQKVRTMTVHNRHGANEFIEMRLKA